MSATQFDALMRATPEQVDDSAKAALARSRGAAVQGILQQNAQAAATRAGRGTLAPAQALREGVRGASAAQLKAVGTPVITAHAADLRHSQFDDIMKSNDYTETEKNNIRQAREDELWRRFNANPATFFTNLLDARVSDTDIANLPRQILTDPRSAPHFTKGMLSKMLDTLSRGDRQDIYARIGPPVSDWFRTPRGSEFNV